eukprot:scaffold6880_cov30-Tisochrysis_lutea.AAC.2
MVVDQTTGRNTIEEHKEGDCPKEHDGDDEGRNDWQKIDDDLDGVRVFQLEVAIVAVEFVDRLPHTHDADYPTRHHQY